METWVILLVLLVLVVAAVVAYAIIAATRRRRREQLRSRFGDEYDRTVAETGDQVQAERELQARERRHTGTSLRELAPDRREWYVERWSQVQLEFVDTPREAVASADRTVTELMQERGFPAATLQERVGALSVAHRDVIGRYREASAVAERDTREGATTEELRAAMTSYREVLETVLGEEQPSAKGKHVADSSPADAPDTKPPAGNDSRPADTPDTRPTDTPDARPTDTPDARPTDTPDTRPTDTPDARPPDTPDARPPVGEGDGRS